MLFKGVTRKYLGQRFKNYLHNYRHFNVLMQGTVRHDKCCCFLLLLLLFFLFSFLFFFFFGGGGIFSQCSKT